jgi:GTP-binding protein
MPGYGFARAPKEVQTSWKRLIEAYLERRKTLVMLFCIFDIRREPDALDMSLLDYLRSVEIPFCILLNKADKLSYSQRLAARRGFDAMAFAGVEPVVFSAQTGLGLNEVQKIICEQLGGHVIS